MAMPAACDAPQARRPLTRAADGRENGRMEGRVHKDERRVLEQYIKERGLKLTAARMTVLEAFMSLESHVTAEAVYEAAKRLDPGIGQATVFRAMKLFRDAGLAREACHDEGARQFEHAWRHAHHDHLSCVRCGAVVEFVDPAIEKAQEAVFKRYGYAADGHRLELYGVCPACAAAGAPLRGDGEA